MTFWYLMWNFVIVDPQIILPRLCKAIARFDIGKFDYIKVWEQFTWEKCLTMPKWFYLIDPRLYNKPWAHIFIEVSRQST